MVRYRRTVLKSVISYFRRSNGEFLLLMTENLLLSDISELILYACPLGPLAAQLDDYYTESFQRCGENAAHRYMPHCTLTGFFHDHPASIPFYIQTLDTLIHQNPLPQEEPLIKIVQLLFEPQFHGLQLESPWLLTFVSEFIGMAESATRTDTIRPKTWLHLSLAYEFPGTNHPTLQCLAEERVDITAPVGWELRFYERHTDNSWTLHGAWSLTTFA